MQSPLFATEARSEVIDKTAHHQQAVHSYMLCMTVAQEEIMLLLLRFALC
jgi:hypothetical protein